MTLRFVTNNEHKLREVQTLLAPTEIIATKIKIEEIQTEDVSKLIRDKVLKAFNQVKRHLFVEHTSLYIKSLNEFPGGLTQIFWDKLGADLFCSLLHSHDMSKEIIAKTIIGYCDTKKIHLFEGEIKGTIAPEPKGSRDFQWDCIFIPDGYSKTFAELGDIKNEISMRKKAFDKFKLYIEREK